MVQQSPVLPNSTGGIFRQSGNTARRANMTLNEGDTPPSYAEDGTLWWSSANDPAYSLQVYYPNGAGAVWSEILSFNKTDRTISLSNVSSITTKSITSNGIRDTSTGTGINQGFEVRNTTDSNLTKEMQGYLGTRYAARHNVPNTAAGLYANGYLPLFIQDNSGVFTNAGMGYAAKAQDANGRNRTHGYFIDQIGLAFGVMASDTAALENADIVWRIRADANYGTLEPTTPDTFDIARPTARVKSTYTRTLHYETLNQTSDDRKKTYIDTESYPDNPRLSSVCENLIMRLSGRIFYYDNDARQQVHWGLSAQTTQQALDECNLQDYSSIVQMGADDFLEMDKTQLIPAMIEHLKSLTLRIRALEQN